MSLLRLLEKASPLLLLTFTVPLQSITHAVTIEEYLTPTPDSSPTDLHFDGQGNLWFTMINANKLGRLAPALAKAGQSVGITEYPVPTPNSQPHYLAIDAQDRIWFTERQGNKIGLLDPRTGAFTEYPIPTPNSEPHHLAFDTKGRLWFAQFAANKVGRLDPASGAIREYSIPTADGHPHDLAFDAKGRLWFTLGGLFFAGQPKNRLGMLDPATERIVEFQIPPEGSVPHGINVGSGDDLWVTLFFKGKIVRVTAGATGITRLTEYLVSSEKAQPHDLALDQSRNLIWFTNHRGTSIGRLDLSKAEPGTSKGMEEFPIPCDRCNPNSIVLDREGRVWFTEMGMFFRGRFANKIGKLIP
jgi:virginiamycin B lyase